MELARITIKVKKLNNGEFEGNKWFQVVEDGGLVEVKYKVKEDIFKQLVKEKVEGKVIEIGLERKVGNRKDGKLFNYTGEKIEAYQVL